jgi:uncharacterized protein YbjT (DUF2867 family)
MFGKTIVVFNATSAQGAAVAAAARAQGWSVRAVTRDALSARAQALSAQGAGVVEMNTPTSGELDALLIGVDAIFLVMPSLTDIYNSGEAANGIMIVEAAARARVQHLVYSSAIISEARGVLGLGSKRAIEERIAELGLPTTVLRPAFFMENLETYFPPTLTGGRYSMVVPLPPHRETQLIAVADIATATCSVLSKPDQYIGTSIDLVSDALSLAEMAAAWALAYATPTDAIPLDPNALASGWPQGVPLFTWINNVGTNGDARVLRDLIATPTSFAQWLHAKRDRAE